MIKEVYIRGEELEKLDNDQPLFSAYIRASKTHYTWEQHRFIHHEPSYDFKKQVSEYYANTNTEYIRR